MRKSFPLTSTVQKTKIKGSFLQCPEECWLMFTGGFFDISRTVGYSIPEVTLS